MESIGLILGGLGIFVVGILLAGAAIFGRAPALPGPSHQIQEYWKNRLLALIGGLVMMAVGPFLILMVFEQRSEDNIRHAEKLIDAQKYQEAAQYIEEQILPQETLRERGYLMLANMREKQGNTDEAIEVLRRGVKNVPKSHDLHLKLVGVLFDKEMYDVCIGACNDALNQFDQLPNAVPFRVLRADACRMKGDLQAALSQASEIIKDSPRTAAAWRICGAVQLKRGDAPTAIEDLTQALKLDRKSSFAMSQRGRAYLALGDFAKAEADFAAGQAKDPQDADLAYDRGRALLALDRPAEAIKPLQYASDRKLTRALCYLYAAAQRSKNEALMAETEQGLQSIASGKSNNKNNAILGQVCLGTMSYADAARAVDKSDDDAIQAEAAYFAGLRLSRKGRRSEALEALKACREGPPLLAELARLAMSDLYIEDLPGPDASGTIVLTPETAKWLDDPNAGSDLVRLYDGEDVAVDARRAVAWAFRTDNEGSMFIEASLAKPETALKISVTIDGKRVASQWYRPSKRSAPEGPVNLGKVSLKNEPYHTLVLVVGDGAWPTIPAPTIEIMPQKVYNDRRTQKAEQRRRARTEAVPSRQRP
jgi:tetratricopeptide (TPR) repeat protein